MESSFDHSRVMLGRAVVFRSAFPAAFVFLQKHELKNLKPSALATHMPRMQKSWTDSASHSKWLGWTQGPSHSQGTRRGSGILHSGSLHSGSLQSGSLHPGSLYSENLQSRPTDVGSCEPLACASEKLEKAIERKCCLERMQTFACDAFHPR